MHIYTAQIYIFYSVFYVLLWKTLYRILSFPFCCVQLFTVGLGFKIRINTEAGLLGCFIRSDTISLNCLSTLISLCSSQEQRGEGKMWFTLAQRSGHTWFILEVILRMMGVRRTGRVTQGREKASGAVTEKGWWRSSCRGPSERLQNSPQTAPKKNKEVR